MATTASIRPQHDGSSRSCTGGEHVDIASSSNLSSVKKTPAQTPAPAGDASKGASLMVPVLPAGTGGRDHWIWYILLGTFVITSMEGSTPTTKWGWFVWTMDRLVMILHIFYCKRSGRNLVLSTFDVCATWMLLKWSDLGTLASAGLVGGYDEASVVYWVTTCFCRVLFTWFMLTTVVSMALTSLLITWIIWLLIRLRIGSEVTGSLAFYSVIYQGVWFFFEARFGSMWPKSIWTFRHPHKQTLVPIRLVVIVLATLGVVGIVRSYLLMVKGMLEYTLVITVVAVAVGIPLISLCGIRRRKDPAPAGDTTIADANPSRRRHLLIVLRAFRYFILQLFDCYSDIWFTWSVIVSRCKVRVWYLTIALLTSTVLGISCYVGALCRYYMYKRKTGLSLFSRVLCFDYFAEYGNRVSGWTYTQMFFEDACQIGLVALFSALNYNFTSEAQLSMMASGACLFWGMTSLTSEGLKLMLMRRSPTALCSHGYVKLWQGLILGGPLWRIGYWSAMLLGLWSLCPATSKYAGMRLEQLSPEWVFRIKTSSAEYNRTAMGSKRTIPIHLQNPKVEEYEWVCSSTETFLFYNSPSASFEDLPYLGIGSAQLSSLGRTYVSFRMDYGWSKGWVSAEMVNNENGHKTHSLLGSFFLGSNITALKNVTLVNKRLELNNKAYSDNTFLANGPTLADLIYTADLDDILEYNGTHQIVGLVVRMSLAYSCFDVSGLMCQSS